MRARRSASLSASAAASSTLISIVTVLFIATSMHAHVRVAIVALRFGWCVVHGSVRAAGAALGWSGALSGPGAWRAAGPGNRACLYTWAMPRTMGTVLDRVKQSSSAGAAPVGIR